MAPGRSSASTRTTRVNKGRGRVPSTKNKKAGPKVEERGGLREASLNNDDAPAQAKRSNRVDKRKRSESEDHEADNITQANKLKRVKTSPVPPTKHRARGRPAKPTPQLSQHSIPYPIINHVPDQILAVFVFGGGENGELGLGPKRTEALRPCLNPSLDPNSSDTYHVVDYACGGMHTIALTVENKIVTWGVNDNDALGRDTQWDGGLRDIDADSDDEDEELNPLESTPTEIPTEHFPSGTRFTQVAAGDSCSFVLTDTGLVYGWGAFRNSNGKNCFGYDDKHNVILKQARPLQIQGIPEITQIACGANHALALDTKGSIWAWGYNEQNQFGRRLFGRQSDSFVPSQVRVCRNNVKYIASGEYHSFAIDNKDNVWGWGANSFGQAGDARTAGSDSAVLLSPTKIHDLCQKGVVVLDGGAHHSAAVTANGQCLVWGRIDAGQLGVAFDQDSVQDTDIIRCDDRGKPRICLRPTTVPNIKEVTHVACGTDHTIFIDKTGSAHSTGFGFQGQLGLASNDDVAVAQRITAKSVKDRILTRAGAGGNISVVAGPAKND
ncbi:regulator of chromosome condensation 1/beta-lactamase-inhibitor protein II [Nemania sp. FL0031]|nr:regulator of chromosome condensation 1/beta-lactamase-inhibitor protein II [Nemania sp. FL0031]